MQGPTEGNRCARNGVVTCEAAGVSSSGRRPPIHLVLGANTALDVVRRERQRESKARKPKRARRSDQHAAWRPELY
jgi:hypothetical protein